MPNRNPLRFSPSFNPRSAEAGQVIIEYILLLVVTVALSAMIMRSVVNRDPGDAGFLMKRWQGLVDQVAKDDPNKRGP